MRRVLSVGRFALRATLKELVPLSGMGLIWFVMSVLLPYGVFWLVNAWFPVSPLLAVAVVSALILSSPATAALYGVAHRVVRGQRIGFASYWECLRATWRPSLKVGAAIWISGGVLAFDVLFYLSAEQMTWRAIGIAGIWALALWLTVQTYVFPLLVHQEDQGVWPVVKNAAMLTLAYPFFALGATVIVVAATAVSVLVVVPLAATIWMPFVAILNSKALASSLDQIERYREQREAERGTGRQLR